MIESFSLKSTGANLPQDVEKALNQAHGLYALPCGCGCYNSYCLWCGTMVKELPSPVEYDGNAYLQACPNCRPDLFAGLGESPAARPDPPFSLQPPGPDLTPAPDLRRRRYQCPRGHQLYTYRLAPLCPIDGCKAKMQEVVK